MRMTIKRYFFTLIFLFTFLILCWCLLYSWSAFSLTRRRANLSKKYPELFGLRHPGTTGVSRAFEAVKSHKVSMTTKANTTTTTKLSLQAQDKYDFEALSRNKTSTSNCMPRRPCPDEPCNQSSIPKPASSRTDAVIVLTMMRSGSSIIGSLFNERSDVTYLYEPLYPFGERPCDLLAEDRVQVLRHISRCEFDKLPPLYTKAFNRSKRPDLYSRCKIHNVCFTSKSDKVSYFLSRDARFCNATNEQAGLQVCPEPLDSVALNKHCKQSLLVAMKIIYLCKLEWLVPLLEDPDYNIKVVHLVRDPRGTLNSRASSDDRKTMNRARQSADLICEQLVPNVNFADDVLSKSKVKDKYLRVRYEDFASDPLGIAEKIYNFVGINMNTHVRQWLLATTSQNNDPNLRKKSEQSLKRNPTSSMLAWRKELSLEVVQLVQERCSEALQKLGYSTYNNTEELRSVEEFYERNSSQPTPIKDTFTPS